MCVKANFSRGSIKIVGFLKLMNSLEFMFQGNFGTCVLLSFCVVMGN